MEQELKEFIKFKKNYKFKQLDIIEKDGNLYCEDTLLKDENGYVGETDKWVNVGFSLRGMYPKLLY